MSFIKKSLSIIIITCLLMTSTFNTSATTNQTISNTSPPTIILSFNTPLIVSRGQTFDVKIDLNSSAQVSIFTFQLDVIYDSSKLTLNSFTSTYLSSGDCNLNFTPTTARFLTERTTTFPTTSELLKLSFTVKSDAPISTASFSIPNAMFTIDTSKLNTSTTPTTITIGIPTPTNSTTISNTSNVNNSTNSSSKSTSSRQSSSQPSSQVSSQTSSQTSSQSTSQSSSQVSNSSTQVSSATSGTSSQNKNPNEKTSNAIWFWILGIVLVVGILGSGAYFPFFKKKI